jgi:uncharacterized membrane protein (UPF0127 family)
MTRPIDIAFLTSDGRILDVRHGLRPWAVAMGPPAASAVLETELEGLREIEPGMQVRLEYPEPATKVTEDVKDTFLCLPEDEH